MKERIKKAEKNERKVATMLHAATSEKTSKKEESKVIASSSSDFQSGVKLRPFQIAHAEKLEKAKVEEMKLKSTQPCDWLLKTGKCRFGEKCYFKHVGFEPGSAGLKRGHTSERGGRGRGVFRGGRGGRPERDTIHSAEHHPTLTTEEEQKLLTSLKKHKKDDDQYENADITEFEKQLGKVYTDLVRLEPVRRALNSGKSLDMMFIIDCTGSMGSWIEASKKEIKSIIDCVRNQHFNI